MVLGHLAHALRPGGALVIGAHESLPANGAGRFRPWPSARCVYRRIIFRERFDAADIAP
jgi:chemotaxis methyl-accepting protein methylase